MPGPKSFVFKFADVDVHERELHIRRNGDVLPVEPKAFRVLVHLLRHPGCLVPKEELIKAGWGDTAVTDNSLTRNIALLRRLMGDDPRKPRFIETVSTVGYRFIGKVEVLEYDLDTLEPGSQTNAQNQDEFGNSVVLPGVDHDAGASRTAVKRISWLGSAVWRRLVPPIAVFAAVILLFGWYLRRPFPPLRVTGYNPITRDGASKIPVGSDGTRLYFNVKAAPSIGQVALTGGETAPVALAVPGIPHPLLLDLSRDGSSFLVVPELSCPVAEAPIWNVRILGDSVRRLGSGLDAAFSPDGKSVAYSTLGGEIWVVRSDGSDAHKVASVGWFVCDLAWSPDGAAIRFSRGSMTTEENLLWEISSNGSNLHPVLPSWRVSAQECCGRWTPDGKFYAFLVTPRGAPQSEIWVLDERRGLSRRPSTEPFQLAAGPIGWDRPIPGKDGKTIFAQGVIYRGELSRFDFRARQFKPFLGGISAQGVIFSRDGKSVAYVLYPEGTLWKANADGSGAVQLTDPPMQVFLPQWSPDGTQIVFTGFSGPAHHDTSYIVSSEGGSPRRLVPDDNGWEAHAYWSPDGHKIVFNSLLSPEKVESAVARLIDLNSGVVTTVPGSVGVWAPRWSPDGRHLLATSAADDHKLMIFDFNTQQWSTLAQNGNFAAAQWSHDGRYIYFRQPVDDRGVFRIPLTGGKAERVVDLKDWHDAGWFGRYLGLDPTDAPLLLRDIGSKDIYALTIEE
jgi:Tol biopolymer transport system component/DNA-binding winged helix-turn-helix (wHTH) protein